MTHSTNVRSSAVLDLTTAIPAKASEHSPAGITQMLSSELTKASWLLMGSNALAVNDQAQALRMILNRATARGMPIALDINWQPQNWGLAPGSPPTSEVLRRFRPLAESASLIRCTDLEAEWFFLCCDPVRIHDTLAKRPAVLICDGKGPMRWCLGGYSGDMGATTGSRGFLAFLLDGLCRHPRLLGCFGPGLDAVADPDGLADLLLSAAAQEATQKMVRPRGGDEAGTETCPEACSA